jgi:hypothetical protein
VAALALALELMLVAVVVAELLLAFCSPQTLNQKRITLLLTTVRIPFSFSPPITKVSHYVLGICEFYIQAPASKSGVLSSNGAPGFHQNSPS